LTDQAATNMPADRRRYISAFSEQSEKDRLKIWTIRSFHYARERWDRVPNATRNPFDHRGPPRPGPRSRRIMVATSILEPEQIGLVIYRA